jgi:hypothetical protein
MEYQERIKKMDTLAEISAALYKMADDLENNPSQIDFTVAGMREIARELRAIK